MSLVAYNLENRNKCNGEIVKCFLLHLFTFIRTCVKSMFLACEQPLHFEWQAAWCLTHFKLKGLNNCWRNSEQAKKKRKKTGSDPCFLTTKKI